MAIVGVVKVTMLSLGIVIANQKIQLSSCKTDKLLVRIGVGAGLVSSVVSDM